VQVPIEAKFGQLVTGQLNDPNPWLWLFLNASTRSSHVVEFLPYPPYLFALTASDIKDPCKQKNSLNYKHLQKKIICLRNARMHQT